MKPVGCTGCREDHRHLLLHNVRHRGSLHRLCTSCVLKFHPGSFCPSCLDLFDGSPPPSDSIKCSKCAAVAHSACVRPGTAAAAAAAFVCPSCSNPSFSFFDAGAASKRSESNKAIDLKSAKALLAAARIAAVSMSKAATTVRLEAERKVKEAALARKRAREALERAALVASKEKEKGKEAKEGVSDAIAVVEPKKKMKGNSGVASAAAVAAASKRVQSHKLGGYASAPLGNAGMREKEKWGGFQATAVLVQRAPKKGVAAAAAAAEEEKDKSTGSPSSVLGRHHLQNHAVDEEKEKNRAVSGSSGVSGQQQSQNSSCLLEEDKDGKGKSKGLADSDSGPHHKPPLPIQDASVSMVNPGVVFTGSDTASLIL